MKAISLKETFNLHNFVHESWLIEGLRLFDDEELLALVKHHRKFLALENPTVKALEDAASAFAGSRATLRCKPGMNVQVGNYRAPLGSPTITERLAAICEAAADTHPFLTHCTYEMLHPFIDGNGRTGRLLWLWAMQKQGRNWSLGFLHTFYYQTLERFGSNDQPPTLESE